MQLPYGDPILDATTDVVIIASAIGWALMHIMTRVALPADRTPQGSFQEEAKKRRKAERDFLLDAVPGIPCKYGTRTQAQTHALRAPPSSPSSPLSPPTAYTALPTRCAATHITTLP